jgi:hypothetical protein
VYENFVEFILLIVRTEHDDASEVSVLEDVDYEMTGPSDGLVEPDSIANDYVFLTKHLLLRYHCNLSILYT